MSDARSGARTIVDDSLLARFENAREALPELVVGRPDLERFHRPEAEADEPAPSCVRVHYGDWRVVDVDEAIRSGLTPCRTCWKAVLEYLATDPDSAVEYRDSEATPEPSEPTPGPFEPKNDRHEFEPVASLTEEVMIDGGDKYHAPGVGETLCGRSGYRIVDRRAVESHYEPCLNCFADVDSEA
ncbi:hypothetical protein ACOJIV_20345 [Haloarcula sp. AONF1]